MLHDKEKEFIIQEIPIKDLQGIDHGPLAPAEKSELDCAVAEVKRAGRRRGPAVVQRCQGGVRLIAGRFQYELAKTVGASNLLCAVFEEDVPSLLSGLIEAFHSTLSSPIEIADLIAPLYKTLRKKTIADKRANELKVFIDDGKWPEIEKGKKKFRPLTLKACSDIYLKKRQGDADHGDLAKASLSFYKDQHQMVLEELGNQLVSEITTQMIKDYHIRVRDSQSARTANARLFALNNDDQDRTTVR